jgi:RNA polymerase sigma-70 factor (ECF subfamily)
VRYALAAGHEGRVDANDVLQDAFLDAATRLDGYLRDSEIPAFLWLRLVAGERLAIYHWRHPGAKMRGAGQEVSLYRDPLPQASSAALAPMLLGRLTSPIFI